MNALPLVALLPLVLQGAAREELVLPHVLTGAPDPGDAAHVVNVRIDGAVAAAGEVLVAPDTDDLAGFDVWLAARPGDDLPLVLRASANAPFERCLALLAHAPGRAVLFAAGDARAPRIDPEVGLLPTDAPLLVLPVALEPAEAPPVVEGDPPALAVALTVLEPGRKLERARSADVPWSGVGRYRWDPQTRKVEVRVGEARLAGVRELAAHLQGMPAQLRGRHVRLSVGPGATTAEALAVVDLLRSMAVASVALART